MGKFTVILDDRAKGQFPISISTSLALEGLFGIHPELDPPPTPYWMHYDELWINVRTLYRNLHALFNAEQNSEMTIDDRMPVVLEEMEIIRNVVQSETDGQLAVQYYACSYNNLTGLYPHALFKEANTVKQKFYAAGENGVIDAIAEKLGKDNDQLLLFDVTLIGRLKRVLLLSHYPIDLLHITPVKEVALLESHTGVIKKKADWHTKLANGKTLSRIPFDKMTVQCFGDTGGLFKPYPQVYRTKLIELSEKYHWTQISGKQRIMQCVELARDPGFISTISKLY